MEIEENTFVCFVYIRTLLRLEFPWDQNLKNHKFHTEIKIRVCQELTEDDFDGTVQFCEQMVITTYLQRMSALEINAHFI